MDTVRRFLPKGVGDPIQGSMAAMSIDGFDGAPWTPGSGTSMLYHYLLRSPGEASDRILMPRGGIGSLSSALKRRAESMGAGIRLNTAVKSIDLVNGTATGVTLRDRTQISADIVLSSLDLHTTFRELVGDDHLPDDYIRKLNEINYNLGYLQAHLTIEGEPEFVDWLKPYVQDQGHTCPTLAYLPSAEYVADGWDEYRFNVCPSKPICYLYLPSIVDHTLAPEGYHSATIYAPYFPYGLDPDTHRTMKDAYTDVCIASIDKYSPKFSERIIDRVTMSDRYFHSAFSAHNGDFCHGTLSPMQVWDNSLVPVQIRDSVAKLVPVWTGDTPGPRRHGNPPGGTAAVRRSRRSTPAARPRWSDDEHHRKGET